jgi:hypothetical protein
MLSNDLHTTSVLTMSAVPLCLLQVAAAWINADKQQRECHAAELLIIIIIMLPIKP